MDEGVVRARLTELRQEQVIGREALEELQRRERDLQSTLLRIAGAIQVLEELLREARPEGDEA